MDVATVGATSGVIGGIIGFVVGYYRSKAEFTEKMSLMVSRSDCSGCDLRQVVGVITQDMKAGNENFVAIRQDISLIRQDIAAMRGQRGA